MPDKVKQCEVFKSLNCLNILLCRLNNNVYIITLKYLCLIIKQKLLWKWLTSSDEIRVKRDFFKFIVNREISLMVYDVCNVATQLCLKNELKNQARTWNIQSLQSESNARQNCRKASSRSFFPMLCVVVFFSIHLHARIVGWLTARSFFSFLTMTSRYASELEKIQKS